ncbi:MAG: hypothetical protein HYR64_08980 [Fimbriimonas ginsengisoli]|uniref:Uncharacterized protein n=1 Tax=Fimbriimonas ginsengisoli TaxID=1005039 RepID=A0A931LVY2_FIMGI|nr:hypothetical protein [Fimbriimonas ginsengisoli]
MASTPPPFNPEPTRAGKGPNVILIVGIILGVLFVCCAGGGAFVWFQGKKFTGPIFRMANCAIGFSEVQKAVLEYADAHDGKLPNAKTWEDDVRPFYDKVHSRNADQRGPFRGFSGDDWGCSDAAEGLTGVAFNLDLSGKKISDVKTPDFTPLIFEVETRGHNLATPYKSLPKESSPMIFGEHRGWLVFFVTRGKSAGGRTKGSKDSPFTFDD